MTKQCREAFNERAPRLLGLAAFLPLVADVHVATILRVTFIRHAFCERCDTNCAMLGCIWAAAPPTNV
eukprot:9476479-Pyramimonas_sp.AAC.2